MSVTNYNYTGAINYAASASGTSAASNTAAARTSSAAEKKSSSTLNADDFLKLFIKQLQNQDATSPMDSSEMMNQITQLSNMQMMQNMENYSKSNYAVSLVGKYVKATVADDSGNTETVSGTIDRMVQQDGEYTFYIGEKKFSADDITEVTTAPATAASATT